VAEDQSAQTFVTAAESTHNTTSSRAVRDVADRIAYLDPNAAPLTLILQKARKKSVSNSKFEWIEKELQNRWDQVNGAHTSGDTTVAVDNGEYFRAGDLVKVSTTHEVMLVTSVSGDDLTVVRSVGDADGTAAAAIGDNADIVIIGTAHPEGGSLSAVKSHVESYPYNYTQIHKTSFSVTGSEDQSENYTGKDRPRLRAEMAIQHKLDLERSAIFGERALSTSGGDSTNQPRRFSGGLLYYLNKNIKSSVGTLTEPELEDWLQDVFHHTASGDSRLLLAAPLICSVFDQFGMGRIQVAPKEKTFGVAIREFVTTHGTLNIVKHRLLESGVSGTVGYGGLARGGDPNQHMDRPVGHRDTKLLFDIGTPGDDSVTDEYMTEVGWQVELPKVHGWLKGVTG
jgi:hypothetical protein